MPDVRDVATLSLTGYSVWLFVDSQEVSDGSISVEGLELLCLGIPSHWTDPCCGAVPTLKLPGAAVYLEDLTGRDLNQKVINLFFLPPDRMSWETGKICLLDILSGVSSTCLYCLKHHMMVFKIPRLNKYGSVVLSCK